MTDEFELSTSSQARISILSTYTCSQHREFELDGCQEIQCLRSMCSISWSSRSPSGKGFSSFSSSSLSSISISCLFSTSLVSLSWSWSWSSSPSASVCKLVVSFASVFDRLCFFVWLEHFFVALVLLYFFFRFFFVSLTSSKSKSASNSTSLVSPLTASGFIRCAIQCGVNFEVKGELLGVVWFDEP